jgi:hypothetical protein
MTLKVVEKNIYDVIDYDELAQVRRAMRIRLEELEARPDCKKSAWFIHFAQAIREAYVL